MNCQNHSDVPAAAFCRVCGKAICAACERVSQGTIYCEEHAPAAAAAGQPGTPPPPPPPSPWTVAPSPPLPPQQSVSPGLAFLLGLIPGVGAIYNGQYAKGVIHVVILGILIAISNSGAAGPFEWLFGLLIFAWFFYMAFEAYHTAKKRIAGQPVDEFSSLVPLRGRSAGFPVGPILLIGLGVFFLLSNLGILEIHRMLRYWPVFLIVLGAYMLYSRIAGSSEQNREATHEQQ